MHPSATVAVKVKAKPRVCNLKHPSKGPPASPPTTVKLTQQCTQSQCVKHQEELLPIEIFKKNKSKLTVKYKMLRSLNFYKKSLQYGCFFNISSTIYLKAF